MAGRPEWKEEMEAPRLKSLADLFGVPKPVIGMIHLWPLPGAPGYRGTGMQPILDNALRDGEALVEGGVDGLVVENFRCRWASTSFTTAAWCACRLQWRPGPSSFGFAS
jgi:hypothetical protein